MHGTTEQWGRDFVLEQFVDNQVPFLIAAGVAAEGMDFFGINFLSNHDSLNNPGNNEHRKGRLGQSEKTCNAFTDFTQISMGRSRKLMIIFKRSKSRKAHFIEIV